MPIVASVAPGDRELDRLVDAADPDIQNRPHAPGGEAVDWLAGDLPRAVARPEAAMIGRALEGPNGNRTEAARRLGIRRQLLYGKIERYGLDRPGAAS